MQRPLPPGVVHGRFVVQWRSVGRAIILGTVAPIAFVIALAAAPFALDRSGHEGRPGDQRGDGP